ncbi:RNA polymerase sigma factor [Aquimarina macrocephali]|uniref:RNA polymerase sigma factor n=1 Tax=Aquimarina macrocephali TaxID=666563 RepID=UPI003F661ACD
MKSPKKKRFSILFDKHYTKLFNYSFKVVKERDFSQELVQETFIKLWEKIEQIQSNDRSIESFLIVTLKNKIIDHTRKNKTREKHINLYSLNQDMQENIDNEWELSQKIDSIYSSLHPKTIEIFKLSRDQGFTYQEIATQKNISIKTVELHISKALAAFRQELKDYL